MNLLGIFISILVGLIIGYLFYGGLWWTIQMMRRQSHPYFILFFSYLIRSVITLAVFYELLQFSLAAFISGFLSFLVIRQIMITKKGHISIING